MKTPPKLRAEAAAWVARLHGPNRTPEVEAGLKRWLAEDLERAAALESMTEAWERSAQLRRDPVERVGSWRRRGFQLSFSRAAVAACAVALVAVASTWLYLREGAVTTEIGEQRTLTLKDGTRAYLNTDTRLSVHYDERARRLILERGEALFEVAKDVQRPFSVEVNGRSVRALGTTFVVRREGAGFAVTLMEGKIAVEDGQGHATSAPLEPGQRLNIVEGEAPRIDLPSLGQLTAWRRGQIAFETTPLGEAVKEMNRYSPMQVVVTDPTARSTPISGIFRVGDSEEFIRAVAKGYGLQLVRGPDRVELVGSPVKEN